MRVIKNCEWVRYFDAKWMARNRDNTVALVTLKYDDDGHWFEVNVFLPVKRKPLGKDRSIPTLAAAKGVAENMWRNPRKDSE